MAAGGTSTNVQLGPGRLYVAPVGTTEPTTASAALPSAWLAVGYTEDGTEFQFETTSEGIPVAEELDPIRYVGTARTTNVVVSMAETTIKNFALSQGSGAAVANGPTAFNPADPNSQVDVMLVWDKIDTPDNTNSRVLFRQCRPTGQTSVANRKAPTKRLIATTFACSKPTGLTPYTVFPSVTGLI